MSSAPLRRSARFLVSILPLAVLCFQLSFFLPSDTLIIPQPRILFVCPIQRRGIPGFLSSMPSFWLSEVRKHGQLLFVVGGPVLEVVSLTPEYALLVLPGVDDAEYPPFGKELGVYEALLQARFWFEFVMKFDSDTFVDPSRLQALIVSAKLSPSAPLYMGSPLHHCQCNARPQKVCTRGSGIIYCSGAAILLSKATVLNLAQAMPKCRQKIEDDPIVCNSSDSRLGWCLNNVLGLTCVPALNPLIAVPPLGHSWSEPNEKGEKAVENHHFCQELTSQGGVKHRHIVPRPYAFSTKDFEACITFHPLKTLEDMRYVSWNMYHFRRSDVEYLPSPEECVLHIGVFTSADDIIPRMVIRKTWGAIARATGVQVTFVLAEKNISPHVQLFLETERKSWNDVIQFSHFEDTYANLFEKTMAWFSWAAENSACAYIMKLDQDSYPRILPILRYLRTLPKVPSYIGTMWGAFTGNTRNATVVSNKSSSWYMSDQYPHPTFPPYMSGGAYIISHGVTHFIRLISPSSLVFRIEDAGLGILLSKFAPLLSLQYSTDPAWDVEQCNVDTTYDNPAYSLQFNMYSRFTADMSGNFCQNALRKVMLPAGVRDEEKVGIWDY